MSRTKLRGRNVAFQEGQHVELWELSTKSGCPAGRGLGRLHGQRLPAFTVPTAEVASCGSSPALLPHGEHRSGGKCGAHGPWPQQVPHPVLIASPLTEYLHARPVLGTRDLLTHGEGSTACAPNGFYCVCWNSSPSIRSTILAGCGQNGPPDYSVWLAQD